MKRSALILILLLLEASVNAFVFDSSKADSSNSVTGLSFKSRFYAPTTTSTTQSSSSHEYGFGVGGVEHFVLDSAEGYIYTQSALGYISIIDSQNVANMSLAAVEYQSLDLRQYSSQLKDIAVCGQYLFVTLTGKNHIQVYNKLLRNDRTNDPLELTHQLSVEFPQYLFPSPTCKYIAVTNHRDQSIALVQGAVRIITQLDGPADQFQIKSVESCFQSHFYFQFC